MSRQKYNVRFILREQLYQECLAMGEYSLANGLFVPIEALKAVEQVHDSLSSSIKENEKNESTVLVQPDIEPLINAHQILSNTVKPAQPRTILLLYIEKKSNSWWNFLGPVPLVRQMMVVAFICLCLFIGMPLYEEVAAAHSGDLSTGHGVGLLKNLIFYISAAGLGASFSALYKVNSYITNLTYDPTHQASYWIRFLLGLISGLILAVMISEGVTNTITPDNAGVFDASLFRPMIAILGGFSADLFYTILVRFVETVESLFKGSTKNFVEMKQQEAESRLEASKTKSQIDLATQLLKLQKDINNSPNIDDVQQRIDQLLDDCMPNGRKIL